MILIKLITISTLFHTILSSHGVSNDTSDAKVVEVPSPPSKGMGEPIKNQKEFSFSCVINAFWSLYEEMSKSEHKIYRDFISNISEINRHTLNVCPKLNLYDTLIPSELNDEKNAYYYYRETHIGNKEKINLWTNMGKQNSIIENDWTGLNVENKDYLLYKRIFKSSASEVENMDENGKLFRCSKKMKEYLKYSTITHNYYIAYLKLQKKLKYSSRKENYNIYDHDTDKYFEKSEKLKKDFNDYANVSFLKKLFFLVLFCIDVLEADMKGFDNFNVANDNKRSGGDLVEIKVLPIFQEFARSIFEQLENEFNTQ